VGSGFPYCRYWSGCGLRVACWKT